MVGTCAFEAFHLVMLVSGTLDSGPNWIYMYTDN